MNGKIILKKSDKFFVIEKLKIISIQKEDSIVKIITSQDIFYSNKTLKNIEDDLESCFFRLRNDVIINMLRIDRVNISSNTVFMDNKQEFIIAKRKKKEFVDVINGFHCNLC